MSENANEKNSNKQKVHTFLKSVDDMLEDNEDNDSKFYYRGLSDVDYQLIPSIGRKGEFLNHEDDIINASINERPDVFGRGMDDFERLTLLQHYGIPTRLMDITSNVLVALYFACRKGKNDKDGVVHIFKSKKYNSYNSDFINRFMTSGLDDKKLETDRAEYIFLEAPKNLLRQRVQQGAYVLFKDPTKAIDTTKNNQEYVGKISIGKSKKDYIRKQLEGIGISESSLFPENIDLLGKNIRQNFEK